MQTNIMIKETPAPTAAVESRIERFLSKFKRVKHENVKPENTLDNIYATVATIDNLEEYF